MGRDRLRAMARLCFPPLGSAAVICAACAAEPATTPVSSGLFSEQTHTVKIEVDYMPGAEPYTGAIAEGRPDTWALFSANLERLFPEGSKELDYPTDLDAMSEIAVASQESYSVDEILDLAEVHRDAISGDGVETFYFVWLDGYFRDDDGVEPGVLGVSIGRTGVVAMFKPVISGATNIPAVARFGEQSTLIHEFGHAIGLVNNGVPLTTDHHDRENGAHCSNRDCVMYWALESIADIINFAEMLNETGSAVVFDDACLQDIDAASQ